MSDWEAVRLRAVQAEQRRRQKAVIRARLAVWWANTWVRQQLWRIRND